MLDFEAKQGLLYVVATLLPLASFVVLLLTAMVRSALRSQREAGGFGQTIYEALGGDTPRKWPAFVATAAIGLSFVCAVAGFVLFKQTEHELHDVHENIKHAEHARKDTEAKLQQTGADEEKQLKSLKDKRKSLATELHALHEEEHALETKFAGTVTWASLTTRKLSDAEKAK